MQTAAPLPVPLRATARLLERTGFRRRGHLPGIVDFDGFVCGQLIYGREVTAARPRPERR